MDQLELEAERLPCVAHTLQLAIKDGLKDIRSIEKALNQAASLVGKAHQSYKVKERLEINNISGLHQKNVTRWSSQFLMIKSLLSIPTNLIDTVFEIKNCLSDVQRATLNELMCLLEYFYEATTVIQTEECSIGLALPYLKGKLTGN